MSRPRKRDKGLPAYVRIRHGSYHYKDHKLCRVEDGEAKMYEKLAARKRDLNIDSVPAAVAMFKIECPQSEWSKGFLDVFSEEFKEYRVEDVTSASIRASVKDLYPTQQSSAIAYKSRISRFFRWCIEEKELIKVNPCREVWLKKPKRKKSKWTDALFWAVRDKLSPMQKCYHDLSFLLYQRTTDVRHLMRSQIEDGVIHFEPTKTEESSGAKVDIPITPAIQAVLDEAGRLAKLQAGPGGDAPVIQTTGGTIYSRSGIYTAYRRADEALHGEGTPIGLNPKALRPYAATSAKKRGSTLEQLKAGLAHKSIRTTEGYIQQHEVPVSQVTMALPERPK